MIFPKLYMQIIPTEQTLKTSAESFFIYILIFPLLTLFQLKYLSFCVNFTSSLSKSLSRGNVVIMLTLSASPFFKSCVNLGTYILIRLCGVVAARPSLCVSAV